MVHAREGVMCACLLPSVVLFPRAPISGILSCVKRLFIRYWQPVTRAARLAALGEVQKGKIDDSFQLDL
jgi:hypothetical protein